MRGCVVDTPAGPKKLLAGSDTPPKNPGRIPKPLATPKNSRAGPGNPWPPPVAPQKFPTRSQTVLMGALGPQIELARIRLPLAGPLGALMALARRGGEGAESRPAIPDA